ncbi:hypothetical protein RhiirA5_437967 [Rhizophagus irregularis]|uniref:Uncharacterized protein n=1 Tax=Rhizophagus irregularis TaxID=588596 RepID=A0A2I1EKG0_9GLOM|nr:hypothetical protein RhiirA5_437967 [Rhizophagus irregularis]PKC63665.1 hypothetical protein RhiirA1_463443 [Rhizophagus irregularis]PKY22606.1 hypothetical protein RhiirB3_436609 [Rhizophagus irregularis]CAB4485132.1 unnamed protein product [Rhizophagus irregularis]CAB5379774.1 unnamed protein product [Rhizophagus irregularis]
MNPTDYSQPIHPIFFFYQPENDFYYYKVNCKEIKYEDILYFLNKLFKNNLNNREHEIQSHENEHIFFYYQQNDNRFYQVICELVSPIAITNYLNENIYGIKLQQNMEQEQLSFIIEQKQNLEFHLTQYLSNYLLN